MSEQRPSTLGALRASGWRSRSVRDELRANLIASLRAGQSTAERWPGILGYERSVLPQLENAILSRHDLILLGLRGQGKTRLLRQLAALLDAWTPALEGCDLNDDPLAPLSGQGRKLVAEAGDQAPIRWIPRAERYHEKLATPDVTIADLIGDVDPIKAASRQVSLDDEAAISYGLIPRANRGIFAVNELPDLAPRIQVGLLNILEERDVQLRGFPVRIPLDVMLVFSANPEDYTNRGSIITPLRDRIASQILTHYPTSLEDARAITDQEAFGEQRESPVLVRVPELLREAIEQSAFQARTSELVDPSSGVSARLPIALLENAVSNAERRALATGAGEVTARIVDLYAGLSAVTGKIELVFEGEREGPQSVAERVVGEGVRAVFQRWFPEPYQAPGRRPPQAPEAGGAHDADDDVYKPILDWFAAGNALEVGSEGEGQAALLEVPTLCELVETRMKEAGAALAPYELPAACELVLEGLHQASLLAKERSPDGVRYGDMLKQMFSGMGD